MRLLISEDIGKAAHLNQAFYSWFGNSIVKDKGGIPLIVHHGTPKAGFDSFITTTEKKKSKNQLDFGAHFTTDKQHAKIYLNKDKRENSKPAKNSGIYDCYLRIIRPLDVNKYFWKEDNPDEFQKELDFTIDIFGKKFKKVFSNPGFYRDKKGDKHTEMQFLTRGNYLDNIAPSILYKKLQEYGYDGVIYNPLILNFKTIEKQELAYIVFNPNQIKSIYNDGTWDLNDNNIYS